MESEMTNLTLQEVATIIEALRLLGAKTGDRDTDAVIAKLQQPAPERMGAKEWLLETYDQDHTFHLLRVAELCERYAAHCAAAQPISEPTQWAPYIRAIEKSYYGSEAAVAREVYEMFMGYRVAAQPSEQAGKLRRALRDCRQHEQSCYMFRKKVFCTCKVSEPAALAAPSPAPTPKKNLSQTCQDLIDASKGNPVPTVPVKFDAPAPTDERLREARVAVCNEIIEIMATYREQEKSSWGVDTPGGLEHMGDVWRLFMKWESLLSGTEPEKEASSG